MKKNSIIFSVILALALVLVIVFTTFTSAFAGGNCPTYNNKKPGGTQLVPGVDAVELRPNQRQNAGQLWYNTDNGLWENEGGKFSLLFPNEDACKAYFANPRPNPMELKAKTATKPRCPASIGDQRWLKGDEW